MQSLWQRHVVLIVDPDVVMLNKSLFSVPHNYFFSPINNGMDKVVHVNGSYSFDPLVSDDRSETQRLNLTSIRSLPLQFILQQIVNHSE